MLVCFCLAGCSSNTSEVESSGSPSSGSPSSETRDDATEPAARTRSDSDQLAESLKSVGAMIERQAFDDAAEELYSLMIRHPDSDQAKLLTAQVEAARRNLDASLEISQSVDVRSKFGPAAVNLRSQVLAKLGRHNEAADVVLSALEKRQDVTAWRHNAWQLLNVVGRRQEASEQALALCRLGLATEGELISLVRRQVSFPTPEMAKNDPRLDSLFAKGLGKARWYFSLESFEQALEHLEPQAEKEFSSPAAEAMFGRLLAETQNWERFVNWHAGLSAEATEFSDYWSALGTYFLDNRRDAAAVRALLEAIRRDPTDRICYHRLSKGFLALGRKDDADQFRVRAIDIAHSERALEQVIQSPASREHRTQLARYLLEFGRPFETLGWTATAIPASAIAARQQVAQQRSNLLSDPSTDNMAVETALLELDPNDFEYESELKALLSERRTPKLAAAAPREIRATPRLVNRADEMGLEFQWYKDVDIDLVSIPIHESLGGGIAVLDFDLDGRPDVYLAQGSGDPPTDRCTRTSQLFRHTGGRFVESTDYARADDRNYSSGLASGDVNQDGFPDLFLGSLGHNRLLINNGDGTFRDATEKLGAFPDRFTASVAIADINGDRLPDLFESNYIEMEGGFVLPKVGPNGKLESPSPLTFYPDSDRWFENLGDGRFQIHEITREIARPGTSLGVLITDVESDGKNEVFVGIDVRPNHFLVQDGQNSFVNRADVLGLANGFDGAANGCMGIATGDFNRDGRFDMQIANYYLEPANLYLQNESGDFTDLSVRYGLAPVTNPFVGFGTKAADFDRNGFLDFIVTNGHIFDLTDNGEPYQMEPQLLMSDGRRLTLTDVQDDSGYWDDNYLGRTIAMLDYDQDGAMDFLVGHLDKPAALLRDETGADGQWIQFELVGTMSERDAIGSKLVLTSGETRLTEWVTAGDGYFCSDEPVVSFALESDDPNAKADVEIHWPSGLVQSFEGLATGNRFLLVEGQGEAERR